MESNVIEASELSVAFRANDLTNEDMETISVINRIALNSEVMGKLLKEGKRMIELRRFDDKSRTFNEKG